MKFILVLQPTPGVEPIRALRALLKVALRRFGLRCESVEEVQGDPRSVSGTEEVEKS